MALQELLKVALFAGYAGSVKVKSDREKAAKEAEAEAARTATEQEQKFELKKQAEKAELDLKSNIYLNTPMQLIEFPDGTQQLRMIGSPLKMPDGAIVKKEGSYNKGFTDVAKPFTNAYMVNGTPMSAGQVRNNLGIGVEMLLGTAQYPFAGQFQGGEFKATTQTILDMNKVKEVRQVFNVAGEDYTNYGAAYRASVALGAKIRITEKVLLNGKIDSQTSTEFSPDKDVGVEKHYGYVTNADGTQELLVDTSEAELRRNLNIYEAAGAKVEYGSKARFIPGLNGKPLMVRPSTIDMESTFDIELVMKDGSTVLSSEATEDDYENAIQQRPVEIQPSGDVQRKQVGQKIDIGKTAQAIEDAEFVKMVKGVGEFRIGPRFDIEKSSDQISQIATATARAISAGHLVGDMATPESQTDYVAVVGPELVQYLRPISQREGQVVTSLTTTARAAARSQGLGPILAVPGMLKYLETVDVQGDENRQLSIQNATMMGGPTVLSVEPITTNSGEVSANLYTVRSLSSDILPFVTTKLQPLLTRVSGDEQKAKNILSALMIDKRDPKTLRPIQREDGLGPVVEEVQPTIIALKNMNDSTIVGDERGLDLGPAAPAEAKREGQNRLTQLDLFEAVANGRDETRYPVMDAATQDDIDSIGIQLVAATDGKIEPMFHTIRGFVSGSTPYHRGLLQDKYGLNKGTSDGRKQIRAYKTQVVAAGRGIQVANAAINTYYDPVTGAALEATFVGNFELSLAGLAYLGQYAGSRVAQAFSNENYAEAARGLMGSFKLGAQNDRLIIDEENDPFGSNSTLAKELASNIAKINEAGNNAAKRAYAVRGFHITVLAYELAAAIQGGTGGRTISDQDVALILSALKQGNIDEPETQLAALETARDMLMDIRFKAQMLSSDDPRDNAAIVIADEFLARADPRITIENVARSINESISGGRTDREIPPDALLKAYNRSARSAGKPELDSVDDITDAIKATDLYKQVESMFMFGSGV